MAVVGVNVSFDVTAIPTELTGVGRYVMELIPELQRFDDVDLTLLTRRNDATRWPAGPRIVARAPRARPTRLAWEQLALPRLLRTMSPDVHHAPHYTMPERAAVPVVVTIHDMTFFDHPEWHERAKVPVFRRAISRAAERAAAVLCVSETTANRFRTRFPTAPQVFVAPHGVSPMFSAEPRPGVDDSAVLARLGVRPPYVAFLGTLEPRKDLGTLVRAFSVAAARQPDLRLVIAGRNGWGDSGFDEAMREIDATDRVQRLGYVDLNDVPSLLRGATAVVYPSLDEGFGMPVLEAMACGTAVITTAGTVMEEVAGDAALLVAPGDVEGFADAIDTVVAGGSDIEARRARGVARAGTFTWRACAEEHRAAYRSVG